MADRGLFIRIAGGVDPNTIKSMRNFAVSLSRVGAAARGLENVTIGKGLDSTVAQIKRLDGSINKSIVSIISNVDRYKRSAQELSSIINSNTTRFRALSGATIKAGRAQQGISSGAIKADKALRGASLSARKYAENLNKLNAGNVGYISSTGRFVAATDRITDSTKKANKQLGVFGNAFEHINRRVKQFGAFVVAASVVHGFTNALAGGVRVMSQYDQGLKNLQAIIDITASQAEVLGDKIQDVSRRTKFSATEVAEGVQTLGQAGLTMQESMSAITGVARLATGTMSNFATVSDLVTTTLNAFNLAATDSARVADVFANAINNSKLSVDKLGTAFNYVGAAGNQAGLTLNEVSGTLMTLADNGLRASTMGTGLRRMMLKMIDASSDLASDLNTLGKNVDDINPKLAGWENSLENLVPLLWDARRETVDMGKAVEYFGTRAAQVAAVLIRNAADGSNALSKAIGQTREFGAAADMADTQIEGLSLSFKNLQDRIKLIAVALGEAGVTNALKALVDIAAVLASGIEALIKKFDEFGRAVAIMGTISALALGINKLLIPALGKVVSSFGGIASSAAAATTALGSFRAVVSSLVMSLNVWSIAISAFIYLVYRYANAHNKAAKAASKHAQELKSTGESVEEWGESLKDAFGTQDWENTVKRFEDIEVAGKNLSRMLEEELGYALEEVPYKGQQGFEDLEKAIKSVSTSQFEKQIEAAAKQIDEVIKSAGVMQTLAGTDIPEGLQKSQREAGKFGKAMDWVAGAFAEFNKYAPMNYLQAASKWTVEALGPDKQEMLENYKDGVYNLTDALDSLAEARDWKITDAVEATQKAVETLEEKIDGDATPTVNKFISDMSSKWGDRAVREFEKVQNRVGNLGNLLRDEQITIDEFIERYSELEVGSVIPEGELKNIKSVDEALDLLWGTTQKLNIKKEELKEQVNLLFKGEKELEEVIRYVREEMNLSEKMTIELTQALLNLSAGVDNTINSYDKFLEKIKNLGPEASKSFKELTDVQKAELQANFEEVENAGNKLREFYESIFEMPLEEAKKELDKKEISRLLSDYDVDVTSIDEVFDKIREEQRKKLNELFEDLSDKGEETDVYEQWATQISNAQKKALLEVEKGSKEALRIRKEYAERELQVAQKRFDEDPSSESQAKLLDAKKEYADAVLAVEEKLTEDILDEVDKRIESIERKQEKAEVEIESKVISGDLTEAEAEVQIAKNNLETQKEIIEERKRAISLLREEKADEEKINKAINEKKEVELEAKEASNEYKEAKLDQIKAVAEREESLAELRRETALAGIEEENERFKIVESNRVGVESYLEKEKKLVYEVTKAKLDAEKTYRNQRLQSLQNQLKALENFYGEETAKGLLAYKELEQEKIQLARQSATKIMSLERELNEARIRSQGSTWDQMKLGIDKFYTDYQSQAKDIADNTQDLAKTISQAGEEAFASWIMGSENAKEAFKGFGRAVLQEMANMLASSVVKQFMGMFASLLGGSGPQMGTSTSAFDMSGLIKSFHTGGVVGIDGERKKLRLVNSSLFDGAKKLHDGLSSLSSDEYPAILQKGEVVFTQGQLAALGEVFKSATENESRKDSAPNIEIKIENKSGENVAAKQGDSKFDGDKWILNVVLDAANRNKNNFGKNLKGSLSKA